MLRDEVNKAFDIIQAGGIILYPTDTIWGIGCDATNESAVAKILKLKGRPENKSLIILLDNENRLDSYVSEVPEIAYDLIEYAENPLTIVFSGAKNLAKNVVNADSSVGIRIAKHPFCQQLIQRFRKPIVSTSANLSGENSPATFSEISGAILDGVDYVVDFEQDKNSKSQPSTIMKLEANGQFSFIRR
ncbi:L-threonylcarbamoyladenylate synthase [Paradesertivirga mongoliensis]|uniref:L-threonylcarbamoyladenylate synthase n=1 Tax=Paradesertivirga mongoliensis TaxID=2100740 RepID=A0ABW4ZL10_9SPHI|nr:L-threonylcarbamoyladenylate synthase [Pedobacter mongoliensis]